MAINFHPFCRLKSSACLWGSILAMSFFSACRCPAQEPATNSTAQAPSSVADAVSDLLSKSSQHLTNGDLDQAVREASLAIQLDSHNASAYELRGAIYVQEKLWDRAERDYTTADKISPDIAYKYKLAEIKFLQKDYDDARLRFVALQGDARLGDLATYKIFLCDLLDRHETLAARELGALDQAEKHPSYYYCHAAWNLYHDQRPEANKWFASAQQLFDSSTNDLYVSSLIEAQPLHIPVATFATKDGNLYDQARVFLEDTGLRTSTPTGWVTVPLDQLPDDLSVFSKDLREQIAKRRAALPATTTPISLLTFTTKLGKSYDHVRWSVGNTGLAILTPDGWITLPFGQLPDDLSPFPPDLQQTIRQKHHSIPNTPTDSDLVSFTTRHGKRYEQVKASMTDDGLLILTPDGWITVPFGELPDDLSEFPAEWRSQMLAKHPSSPDDLFGMKLVSFTTRKGKHYDQVRAALEETGLRLLTSLGWIAVPFDQLPDDLSVFPEEWREKIAARQTELRKSGTPSQPGVAPKPGSNPITIESPK
jgi:tetratricopeptide (TPR) repeat protein